VDLVPSLTLAATTTLAAIPGVPEWLSAERLAAAGLVVVALVVFAETGLLVGFFLPGDSLLFTAGLFVAQGYIDEPLWLVCLILCVAAVAGNAAGYGIGARAGPAIFNRPDSRFFKQSHVDKTYAFFDAYGNRAIVLGRFVPIVRTFITVLAGVGRMPFRRFLTYSAIGAVLWAAGVTVLGYYLGQIGFVRNNIEVMLIIIVLVSVVPIGIEFLRERSHRRDARYDEAHERERVIAQEVARDD
jgi:membrane-associated protein